MTRTWRLTYILTHILTGHVACQKRISLVVNALPSVESKGTVPVRRGPPSECDPLSLSLSPVKHRWHSYPRYSPLRNLRARRTFVRSFASRRCCPFQRVQGCANPPSTPVPSCTCTVPYCTCHAPPPSRAGASRAVATCVCRMSSPFALITGDVLHLERREDWQGAGLPSPRERWADGGEGSAKAPSPRAQPTLHPSAQPTLHLHLPLTKGILALTLALALAPTLAHALT